MAFSLDLSQSASHSPREATRGRLLAVPAVLWLFLFFIMPLAIVVLVSFMTRGSRNLPEFPLTFEQIGRAHV